MSDTQNFTGTRPVAEQHRFDEAALAAWLHSRTCPALKAR